MGIGAASVSRMTSPPLVARHPEVSDYEETTEVQLVATSDAD